MTATTNRRASIPFILITVLIDMMGIGLILPVIPSLVGEFTTSVESQAYWYGALSFTFGFRQFLAHRCSARSRIGSGDASCSSSPSEASARCSSSRAS